MTCESCSGSCGSCTTCETTCCTSAPLTYGGTGSEISGDMVTAIINNVNVQQAILDLVGDLSGARTCDDVADCIVGNLEVIGELITLIQSLMGDLNCDDVAECIEGSSGIEALTNLIKSRTSKHAACVVGEADFHRILAGGNGRVLLPKKGKYEFFSYEK